MADLIDILSSADDSQDQPISELRLGQEPACILLFTSDVDSVRLHYEPDESVRAYVQCTDPCPLCYLGSQPRVFHLLPVYNIESRAVEVLRISDRFGPGSLGGSLLPLLKSDATNTALMVARNGAKYTVTTRPLAEHADRGTAAIQAFLDSRQAGLELGSAFWRPDAQTLAEVERIRRKLDAIGGWKPTTSPPAADSTQSPAE